MQELTVYDPAMCCSSGVCGPEVDARLVQFAADLEWLRGRGFSVRRFGLSHEPGAFAAERTVREALQREGTRCLPLLLVNGQVAARGRYPRRREMEGWVESGTTRFLFFTGKGGVGKTSHACAAAVQLADAGRAVLLVSTDPASNLSEVLGTRVGTRIAAVAGVPGLHAVNIDPQAAADAYRERAVGPVRGLLPEQAIRQMEEQLSGACTVEIAAFGEFAALLTDAERIAGFDHVVFDTAPTGHTLRLLELSSAWTGFLDAHARGASCLGPISEQRELHERYRAASSSLSDPLLTTVVLVSRPEEVSLGEAARTSHELREMGLANQRLVVNGIFRARDGDDPLARALEARGRAALDSLPAALAGLPRTEAELLPDNVVGLDALRAFGGSRPAPPPQPLPDVPDFPDLGVLVDGIAEAGRGIVMLMGKGGVGKTSLAAAIAVELAARGLPVHLSTTDPAAHLEEALGEEVPDLRVSRIDPREETRAYTERVLAGAATKLDAEGRALLEEDLRSPCTEEVAVFHAFSRLLSEGRRGFVVLDTAPTGHTLLLLDATGAYDRQVRMSSTLPGERVITPMTRLRDPEHTRVLIVTLPETTPVQEAERLQADLRRAGIEPFGWIVNQSLAAAETRDPLLRQRAAAELPLIERVRAESADRFAVVAFAAEPPVGAARLRRLAEPGRAAAASAA
jgi:arsenite/tail-anchored protein-transporting ATPase